MNILQINTSVNTGSTGRIAEEIGRTAIQNGHNSTIAYSVAGSKGSRSDKIRIGSKTDRMLHGLKTRVLDLHGFGSKRATETFVKKVEKLNPDIIGLHNIHGYYINIEVLFNCLKRLQKPVVWTFHDCWPFTGHCTYFDSVGCKKWIDGCFNCPKTKMYPASYVLDNSKWNYARKKELFNGVDNLRIVTPSHWLSNLVQQSFLQNYPVRVIHNGVDTEVFSPGNSPLPEAVHSDERGILLGVASVWDRRKGLDDFLKLNKILEGRYKIVLVGLNKDQLQNLPDKIIGIARTENTEQLAALYSKADVFLNPTWQDNFPTTNIEALSCGTPVITYDTGGSPEAITEETGRVVKQGDIEGLKNAIGDITKKGKPFYRDKCRNHARTIFDKNDRFRDYIDLYEDMLVGKS